MLDSLKTRISPAIVALLLVASLASAFVPRASAASNDVTAPDEEQAATRIVGGGYPSQPWPWMASIEDTRDGASDYEQHFCGGALIHPRLVVTAAHCVLEDGQQSVPIGSLEVMLGKTQLSAPGGEQIAVSRVVVHPNYGTPTSTAHDMALLFLSRSSAQQPATILSPSVQLREGNSAGVMGWGLIRSGRADWNDPANRTDHLKGLDLAIWSDANCARAGQNQTDQGFYRSLFDSQTMICAGFRPDSPDATCNGDSGGPMMVHDSAGNWYLTGLVSWGGWGCTGYNSPTVFTWLQNPSMAQMLQQGIADAEAGTYLNPTRTTTTTSTTQRWMSVSLSRRAARVGRSVRLAVSAAGYQYVRIAIKRGGRVVSNRTVTPGSAIALPTRKKGQLRITVSALNTDGSRGQTKVLKLRVYR
jgi:secreted trypsin-like serine protease